MEPDGTTRIVYVEDTAAGIKAMLAKLKSELGETPTRGLPYIKPPLRSNERPWHKHTLPNRRRR